MKVTDEMVGRAYGGDCSPVSVRLMLERALDGVECDDYPKLRESRDDWKGLATSSVDSLAEANTQILALNADKIALEKRVRELEAEVRSANSIKLAVAPTDACVFCGEPVSSASIQSCPSLSNTLPRMTSGGRPHAFRTKLWEDSK